MLSRPFFLSISVCFLYCVHAIFCGVGDMKENWLIDCQDLLALPEVAEE